MRRLLPGAALVLLAAACDTGSDAGDGPDDGAEDTTSSGSSGGVCRGQAWGCNDLALPYPTDVGACSTQAGCS